MDLFTCCPVYITPNYTLRLVEPSDAAGLFKVYSEQNIQPYLNTDGYPFALNFTRQAEMEKCIALWRMAYEQRRFIRWTVLDFRAEPAGTMEMSLLKGGDRGEDVGLLRLDLAPRHEFSHVVDEILDTALPSLHEGFGVRRLVTKATRRMLRRKVGLCLHGFFPSQRPITIPCRGVAADYGDYWGHTHFLPGEKIDYSQGGDAYVHGDFPELRPGYGEAWKSYIDRRDRRGTL